MPVRPSCRRRRSCIRPLWPRRCSCPCLTARPALELELLHEGKHLLPKIIFLSSCSFLISLSTIQVHQVGHVNRILKHVRWRSRLLATAMEDEANLFAHVSHELVQRAWIRTLE